MTVYCIGDGLLNFSSQSVFNIIKTKSNEIEAIFCIIHEAVEGYLNSPSPVLYVDACFSSSKVKLLTASFMDANHTLQNIGLYVCGEENINHYMVFFSELLKAGIIKRTM